jgi:hypothetical protein
MNPVCKAYKLHGSTVHLSTQTGLVIGLGFRAALQEWSTGCIARKPEACAGVICVDVRQEILDVFLGARGLYDVHESSSV